MSILGQAARPLVARERMSREDFFRRWEALPELKRAELIGGIVYVPSPVSVPHGSQESLAAFWVRYYAAFTPGCRTGSNCTWLMLEDAPQPDCYLCILPECGGQSQVEGNYAAGAPELAVEVAVSSASYDLGPKLELYRAAGVQEYLAVLVEESAVIWRRLVRGAYSILEPGSDGLLRSVVFPGLSLDPRALLRDDAARILDVLQAGLQSPEHQQFVELLASRRRSGPAAG